jgi:hypothetical protein
VGSARALHGARAFYFSGAEGVSEKSITLRLWLHREEPDAWLVSRSGIGAGEWLPKSQVAVPEEVHALVLGDGPRGPFEIDVPEWLAVKKGLMHAPDGRQAVLF